MTKAVAPASLVAIDGSPHDVEASASTAVKRKSNGRPDCVTCAAPIQLVVTPVYCQPTVYAVPSHATALKTSENQRNSGVSASSVKSFASCTTIVDIPAALSSAINDSALLEATCARRW